MINVNAWGSFLEIMAGFVTIDGIQCVAFEERKLRESRSFKKF
jgi:hypothetical protein